MPSLGLRGLRGLDLGLGMPGLGMPGLGLGLGLLDTGRDASPVRRSRLLRLRELFLDSDVVVRMTELGKVKHAGGDRRICAVRVIEPNVGHGRARPRATHALVHLAEPGPQRLHETIGREQEGQVLDDHFGGIVHHHGLDVFSRKTVPQRDLV